jgi:predicted transcriptional regulator
VRGRVKRPPVVVFDDSSLREAADHMARERIGRLPVVSRDDPERVIGMLSRSDIIESHVRRLQAEHVDRKKPRLSLPGIQRQKA